MQYVVQMSDGRYYVESTPNFRATLDPNEAAHFKTRFSALAVCAQGKAFAYAKILAHEPELPTGKPDGMPDLSRSGPGTN
jgi:hypothetical protein